MVLYASYSGKVRRAPPAMPAALDKISRQKVVEEATCTALGVGCKPAI
ncbi:MAG: hypothetical protein WBA89_17710 [Microcoleus sp.]